MSRRRVLLTWLARDNDPFDRASTPAEPIDGPTLTLLFDSDSPYREQISDVVVFYRDDALQTGVEAATVGRLADEIHRRGDVTVHRERWPGADPTDHQGIFDFVRQRLGPLRQRFAGRELIIHISPGTPTMQTVWVLMASCGFVDHPFQVVKSYRRRDRHGRPPVVPVELDIESYFKVYRDARASSVDGDAEVQWDVRRFESPALKSLYARARSIARLRVPVLILGERGTGKTTLASWIRAMSPYRSPKLDSGWPAIACGQFTGDTIRSELLGHVAGAFTGAHDKRDGLLARADGDTLFLDEIADLDASVQRLLIRAIEEQRFVPLGADETRTSTFRLLTASNRLLDDLRARLHPDFFDRISAFRLTVPPLRSIPADLGWLWEGAYDTARRRAGLSAAAVNLPGDAHAAAVAQLRTHPLPGNIRDLLRVAWHVQAARLDAELGPTEVAAVVDAALIELHGDARVATGRELAQRWATDAPIDDLAPADSAFPAKEMIGALQSWLAGALTTLARRRGVPLDTVSDLSRRTLSDWRQK